MNSENDYKILIVDDQPDNIHLMEDVLIKQGLNYNVLKAPNGKVGLMVAQKRLPDLIITDWEMPEMNGIDFIKALKEDKYLKHIPIIVCTGIMTSSENLMEALNAGAVDYLRKPIDKIELLARVHSALCLSDSYKKINQLLIDSQMAFLRNQVSPHFLMNTLNSIHAQIDINAEEAQSSIIILSKLMRHLLYESENMLNPIGMEIDFIRNYVDLMRLRFIGLYDIQLTVEENIPNAKIPPLLFTSLLENAFKHGIVSKPNAFIHVELKAEESNIIFETRNYIPDQPRKNEVGGIGIENTRKRLDLIYSNNYDYNINTDNGIYTSRLSVPISGLC
ncbi:MAG: response regulator [Bacteroidales bacterium]|nr:response regulator [Bacteroidales bacterium]